MHCNSMADKRTFTFISESALYRLTTGSHSFVLQKGDRIPHLETFTKLASVGAKLQNLISDYMVVQKNTHGLVMNTNYKFTQRLMI